LRISGIQASELEPLVGGTGTDTIDGAVPEADERDERDERDEPG